MKIWKFIQTLSLIGLLTGCSANWHLNKAVKKDPFILRPTVVTKWDTLLIPPITRVDTVLIPSSEDSSVIDNDTVRIVITKFQERLIVKTEVKERPVVKQVSVECPPQLIQPESKTGKVKNYLLLFLASALVIMMFLYRFR
jgi:hypothetical protein